MLICAIEILNIIIIIIIVIVIVIIIIIRQSLTCHVTHSGGMRDVM